MEPLAKVHSRHQPLSLSLNHHRPSFSKPISALSFRTTTATPFKFSSVRASSSTHQNPKPNRSLLQTLNPLAWSLVKTASVTVAAAAALLFTRLHHIKPAIASPIEAPTVESTAESSEKTEDFTFEEKERNVQQHLSEQPNDVEALRLLLELKLKSHKVPEAIEVIGRLIEVEPDEFEWPLLKCQVLNYSGDFEAASKGFEQILQKDPLRVEAFHGLVMAYEATGYTLKDLEKRIESAMQKCKKENKNSDLRNFKLLIAQIRVMESKHSEALKVYEELVKEEPRDFRPYLCQGIIYTLLNNDVEAEKQFEKFRRLVPNDHPYRQFFADDIFAKKLFGEKVEREGMGSRS
ncbi:protein SLOW GREEN 1, chloroplastic-like [Mangifera indica]|uniref:protein SLOW GREEN 1, chloroplastic-like n=1 Tax=Mangifera indica TaxID=29780 RepID=UPI001CF9EEAC|nr:protein SLOW GREEN 1, chloroplastic-like [Mangifera indica]